MASIEPFPILKRRHAPRRACLLFVLTAGCVLLGVRTASPHAELLRSDPASGAVLPTAPRQIRLWFSDPVEAVSDPVTVKSADGTRIDRGDGAVDAADRLLLTTVVQIPAPGTYTVNWRVVSADGHPISGNFIFSVGHVDPLVAVAAERSGDNSARYLQPFGRWLHLLGLIMLSGPIVMLLVLVHSGDAVVAQRLWRLSRLGALVSVPAAGVMLLAQTVGINGSVAEAMHRDAVIDVLRTHWGGLWATRTFIAVALIVLTHWMARRRSVAPSPSSWAGLAVAIAGLAVLILATALNSHSAATPPVVLSVAVDWLHLAATATWVGGLLALSVCVLPWTRSMEPKPRREMLARLVSRFSNMSLVAVEVLIVTGLYHTWAHVSGPEALSTTPYGQALLVKAALIALALVPAAVNLFIVRPQLAAPTDDTQVERSSRRLGRLIRSEAVVAVGILGAAAMLTSLPPAQLLAAPGQPPTPAVEEQPAITFVENAGSAYVRMGVSSGQVGSNRIHLSVLGENGEAVTGQAPRIRDRGSTRHRRVHVDGDAGRGGRRLCGHGGSGAGRAMDAARSRHRRVGSHIPRSPSRAGSRGDPRLG